jgi:hypothetical protein
MSSGANNMETGRSGPSLGLRALEQSLPCRARTPICWAQLKFVALVATQTQETVASQRVLERSILSQRVAAEVAVRKSGTVRVQSHFGDGGDAMPRRRGARLPLHRLREQVVTAVWMKRGVGCSRGTRQPACLPDFINDACGRSAG